MKSLWKKFAVGLAVLLMAGLVGCASTPNRESTGQYIDSATTTAKVKAMLARDMGARSITNIDVSTYKGVVQLSGFVNNKHDIDRAVDIARHVEGVSAVENSLLVKRNLK